MSGCNGQHGFRSFVGLAEKMPPTTGSPRRRKIALALGRIGKPFRPIILSGAAAAAAIFSGGAAPNTRRYGQAPGTRRPTISTTSAARGWRPAPDPAHPAQPPPASIIQAIPHSPITPLTTPTPHRASYAVSPARSRLGGDERQKVSLTCLHHRARRARVGRWRHCWRC